MLELDHLAISGETLDAARSYVEDALGVPMEAGGEHPVFHTHNALLGLEDGLYLEAIAINPDAPRPDRPRWFGLDDFAGDPRLTNWICQTAELDKILDAIPLKLGAPVDLRRGDFRWRMAVPENGVLPFDNQAPALIEWATDRHPAARLTQQGVSLKQLVVFHPQAGMMAEHLRRYLPDKRVSFEMGSPSYLAEFDTPHGKRQIS